MTSITKTTTVDTQLEQELLDLYALINSSNGIIITGHVNADGDDVGSQLAVAEYLHSINKKYIIINGDVIPHHLKFLPNSKWINHIDDIDIDLDQYDTAIVVDSGDIERIGTVKFLLEKNIKIINIDHHAGNTLFGDVNIIKVEACSVGEILYYFFKVNNIEITKNIAVDLYISIVSDTGSFKYDRMHSAVHIIVSDLMDIGVVPSEFNIHLFQSRRKCYIKLLSLILSRIEFYADNKIAVSYLFNDDFQGLEDDDTDGLIENMGIIDSVSVYCLIKEKKTGYYSASLRSKYNVNVAKIAANFSGGGHFKAAGCRTEKLEFEDFKKQLIALAEAEL